MKLSIKIISLSALSIIVPSTVLAAATPSSYFYDFKSFVYFLVYSLFNPLMYIISGLIFIYFFLGVAKYIWSAGDMEKRKEGYWMLVHGVIAITITMSIWGIIYFLMSSFGFSAPHGSYGGAGGGYGGSYPVNAPPGSYYPADPTGSSFWVYDGT